MPINAADKDPNSRNNRLGTVDTDTARQLQEKHYFEKTYVNNKY